MLNVFRRHRDILKWVLVIVVLVFVAWGFGVGYGSKAGPARFVAQGDGIQIEDQEYERSLRNVIASYKQIYGEKLDANSARSLGLERIALDAIFTRKVLVLEARAAGMDISQTEVSESITQDPNFQQNGRFIGVELYKQVLLRNNLSPTSYESLVEGDLLGEKLRNLIQDAVTINDAEVREEYQRRNLKVGLEYALMTPALVADDRIAAGDAEIQQRFEKRREEYRLPERRRVEYALADSSALMAQAKIPDAQVEQFYQAHRADLQAPEQVRARHILIKVEGTDPAADTPAHQLATSLAEQARAGADFAALAKKNSQDPESAEKGGDLGLFPRGRMVPEFEAAAFGATPGSIVGPIRTQFGWHVIRVEEHQAARAQPLEEAREQIRGHLAGQWATDRAHSLIGEFSGEVINGHDFEATARKLGLTVQTTDWISSDSQLPQIGRNTDFLTAAFSLEPNKPSQPITVAIGWTVLRVLEIQAARLPSLAEVHDRVLADVRTDKKRDYIKTAAQRIVAAVAKGDASFAQLVQAEGFTLQPAPPTTWYGSLPNLGDSQAVVQQAFEQPVGAFIGPIDLQEGVVIARVASKDSFDPAAFALKHKQTRESLESQRRIALLQGVIDLLKGRYDLQVNQQRIESIAGPAFERLG
jgi:peptidyl-prolyl cis-trans isomerase D